MTRIFRRDDGGQVLIVVALSLVVLLAAVALALDWGYGLTQRRMMVNAAEAGALAGAKLLATNVIGTDQGPKFTVYEEYVYCVALNAAEANRDYQPGSGSVKTTVVEWNSDPLQRDPVTNEPVYTPFAVPSTPCPAPGTPITTGTVADDQIRYVRVRAAVTYRPFLAFLVGQSTIYAAGAGAARLTGASAPEPGPTWPLMRHFNPDDFNTNCQTQCNPANADPVIFWDSNDPDLVYGNKKGLVDFSRYSPNAQLTLPTSDQGQCLDTPSDTCVPQLMSDWDRRSLLAPVAAFPGTGPACSPPAGPGNWYTGGNESAQLWDKACSIPNWAYHLFGGTLALDSDYTSVSYDPGVGEYRERPDPLSATRAVCDTTLPVDMPSCPNSNVGDWVEVADSGNLGDGIADPLRQFIIDKQQRDEWFDRPTPTGNRTYGHYAVITIYLWDCGETYDSAAAPGQRWSLAMPKGNNDDCSDIHRGNDLETGHSADRVHVLTAVPFTFYEGLVEGSKISGFWGGKIGDSTSCQADPPPAECALNAISNGVYLVPPD
jgi:Flp pilus assembly protein TadG